MDDVTEVSSSTNIFNADHTLNPYHETKEDDNNDHASRKE